MCPSLFNKRLNNINKLSIYSIADLEKVSGIKAHTLRIWEKRYNLLNPERTQSNIRFYRDEDLKKILNIALLNKLGYKISKIAEMSDEAIFEKVCSLSTQTETLDTKMETLTLSVIDMDETKFNSILDSHSCKYGFEITMKNLILPFLEKLHLLWLTGSINTVQEMYISTLFKQKLYAEIDKIPACLSRDHSKILLFLPLGESQELSLLFIHYLLKLKKYNVINLGAGVSLDDLRDLKKIFCPKNMITIVSEWNDPSISFQNYVDELCNIFQESNVIVSGLQIMYHPIQKISNCHCFDSLEPLMNFISNNDLKKSTIFNR